MEFNPNPEQLLRDQQAIVLYFGEVHGKDKTGDSREERDLNKDNKDEEKDEEKGEEKDEEKDETMDTNENRCN